MWKLDNFCTIFLSCVLPPSCSYTLQGFLHVTEFSVLCPRTAHARLSHPECSLQSSVACDSLCPLEITDWFLTHWNQTPKSYRFQWCQCFPPLSLRSLNRSHLTLDTGCVIILNKLPKESENEQFFNHFSSSANLELYTDLSVFSVCVLSVCLLLRESNIVGVTVIL